MGGKGQPGKCPLVSFWSPAFFFNLEPCNLGPTQPKDPAPEHWGLSAEAPSSHSASEADNLIPLTLFPAPLAPSTRLRHLFPTHSFITTLPWLILLAGNVVCLQLPPHPCLRVTGPPTPALSRQMASLCTPQGTSSAGCPQAPGAANSLLGQLSPNTEPKSACAEMRGCPGCCPLKLRQISSPFSQTCDIRERFVPPVFPPHSLLFLQLIFLVCPPSSSPLPRPHTVPGHPFRISLFWCFLAATTRANVHFPFDRGLEPTGTPHSFLSWHSRSSFLRLQTYVELLPYTTPLTASKPLKFTGLRTLHQYSCLWDLVHTLFFPPPPRRSHLWRPDFRGSEGMPSHTPQNPWSPPLCLT